MVFLRIASCFSRITPLSVQVCVASRTTRRALRFQSSISFGHLSEDMESVNTTERLAHLRELMKKNEIDVYS